MIVKINFMILDKTNNIAAMLTKNIIHHIRYDKYTKTKLKHINNDKF